MERQWYKVKVQGENIPRYMKLTLEEAKHLGEYRNLTVTQEIPPKLA